MHDRFHSPHLALLVLTIIGLTLVNLFPLRLLIPVASACTLVWYAATNFAALELQHDKRFAWAIVSWLGIAACVGLFLSLPRWSVVGAGGILALFAGIRWLLIRAKMRPV